MTFKPVRQIFSGLLLLFTVTACSDGGYYLQAARGQLEIQHKKQPIDKLLHSDHTSKEDKERLARILTIRNYASTALSLPNNDSYRSYVELGRPYPVWNLVAAGEFSLKAKTWCFPIAGCINYRGYFSENDARNHAIELQKQGYDTLVAGVPAYSTLTWFDDPVLSSFSHWPAPSVARLIFHELAHQQLYLPSDSDFSEAFATSVELEGVRRWLEEHGSQEEKDLFRKQLTREEAFLRWNGALHNQLEDLYASNRTADEMRRMKAEIIEKARDTFSDLKASWGGYSGYDRWIANLNNANLVSLKTYRRLLPAFSRLLIEEDGDLPAFYERCTQLSKKDREQRSKILAELTRAPKVASFGQIHETDNSL